MRKIKYIVLHCTATPQNTKIEAIQAYWRNVLKWKSPGYHRVYGPHGEIEILADYDKITNGVAGYNSESIHLSYIGGIVSAKNKKPLDNRTTMQRMHMEHDVRAALLMYPDAIVCGHRDFPGVKKACPSFDVANWLRSIGLVVAANELVEWKRTRGQ